MAWKLSQSPKLDTLWCTGSNPALLAIAKPSGLNVEDHADVIYFCQKNDIGLVVIGPEAPLVAGLTDNLIVHEIDVFGPGRSAAQLEGSKFFTKAICKEGDIPTAAFGHFTNRKDAIAYVEKIGAPIVIKADGLAAGKGVTVAETLSQAIAAVDDCFSGNFGEAGASVVVEEFLEGEEASIFVLCDGETMLPLASAQDHKRVGENDTGPNTGGMGSYSPAPVVTNEIMQFTLDRMIAPTMRILAKRGTPFRGVLYAGLMIKNGQPKLIEYNCRFGDPECQVLMMRMKNDLLPLLVASAKGQLRNQKAIWSEKAALSVVMASKGYPGDYKKGTVISGLETIPNPKKVLDNDAIVFHAGTKKVGNDLIADGGRVLNVTALGSTIADAQTNAYRTVDKIDWPDGFCRRDIGWRAIDRNE